MTASISILRHIIVTAAAIGTFGTGSFAAHAQSKAAPRPFDVHDLFELEAVGPANSWGGPYAVSKDGSRLAVVRVRPRKLLKNFSVDLNGAAGGDVWVQLKPGEALVNITRGAADGSSWWAPEWSPDGRRLAMLSTRGGNVRLWLWEPGIRRLRQVGKQTVDLQIGPYTRPRPYQWSGNESLIYSALPADEKPDALLRVGRAPERAPGAWAEAAAGANVTASVVDSGATIPEAPSGRLVAAALSGPERIVAYGSSPRWLVSPTGKAVAYLRRISFYTPQADTPIAADRLYGGITVEIASLVDGALKLQGAVSRDVVDSSLRWSADGRHLAFLGYDGDRSRPPALYRADAASGAVHKFDLPGLKIVPGPIEWTADDDILVQGADDKRQGWWRVRQDGQRDCFTCDVTGLASAPRSLMPQYGRTSFVGQSGGEIWRFSPATRVAENLTADHAPPVGKVTWPTQVEGEAVDSLLFMSGASAHRLDLRSNRIDALSLPEPGVELVAYAAATQSAVFLANDDKGLRAWRGEQRLFEGNMFLQGIEEGRFQQIDYTSLDGKPAKGWALLPPGYIPGRRYPLLAWVYGGMVAGAQPPSGWKINGSSALNMQIPAARGYVVLLPSMPLAPPGTVDDPIEKAPDGVLPAVDKLVEMGIADPERLFVAGQSFGGYSTLGLITKTNKFKAAAALAAPANLISLYGAFDARERYEQHPQEILFQVTLLESDQLHMGGPPWRELDRYVRNSPLFATTNIQTPVLIMQGDLDYVGLQQGEEMFTSLYRQGKRARFVRYWGEGHVLQSPANVKDMWDRIFAWFEEFSGPRAGERPAAAP